MSLPVKLQSDSPGVQELRLRNGVKESGKVLIAAMQFFSGAELKKIHEPDVKVRTHLPWRRPEERQGCISCEEVERWPPTTVA